MRIAAIDQGTTSTRVLIVDGEGQAEIVRSIAHRQFHPHPGWVEHDPLELMSNIQACLVAVGAVDTIGIANQGESCLAWNRQTGEPLSPVIVWQDNRTTGRMMDLEASGAASTVVDKAGLPLDPYFSASKLGWIMDNVPAAAEAWRQGCLCLGTTDAFFLHRLTGAFVTDVTTASRTSLMNLHICNWDPDLCRIFGVPIECLPEIRRTVGDLGAIGATPVRASVVDQQAALFGHGCRRPGDGKITFGTGAFALVLTGEEPVSASRTNGLLPTVAWSLSNGTAYALDGGIYDAGSAVDWAIKAGLADSFDDLQAFSDRPAIERGLAFVPAFSGLACPYWERSASPVLIGLGMDMTKRDICQALLEGIALLTCQVLDAMQAVMEIREAISIDGGLSRSAYFCQFLADCTGRIIEVPSMDELTAYGVASLVAAGDGIALIPDGAGKKRAFEPRAPRAPEWRRSFGLAVERSRNWR